MSETSEILRTCIGRLEWARNQRKCVFFRLNSGSIFASYTNKAGQTKGRRIRLCPEGTADLEVIQFGVLTYSRVTFIETKLEGEELSDSQKEFKTMVEAQGCRYMIVRNADELEALWV